MDAFEALINQSLEQKKGLTFFIKGQTVAGYVTKKLDGAVEARNQTFGTIIVLLDRVDAIAAN